MAGKNSYSTDNSGTVLNKNGVQGKWRIPSVPQPYKAANKSTDKSSLGNSMAGKMLKGIVTAVVKK